ncbi:hypothetical protein ACQPYA_11000 [Micromonospora sp. CA-263727]|uniref:hypothetical protein n=1 Tax=Micromonospora sp. CA-263727 TaxID=3239967 RepID=UPI003D8C5B84
MAEHIPARPSWRCRDCGANWPCQPAKLALQREYEGHSLALMLYLMACLYDLLADSESIGVKPDVEQSISRVVGWAIDGPLRVLRTLTQGR